ncbi:hypothetical protein EPUL_003014, partial [Erysiphe pulchra]
MSLSRKRSRAQFNHDQDEVSVENDRRTKKGKGITWETANLLPKYNVQNSAKKSVSGCSGTLATPEFETKKSKVREKDIYDFTSSDSEDHRQYRWRKGPISSIKRITLTNEASNDASKISVGIDSSVEKKRNLKAADKELIASNSSRKEINGRISAKSERQRDSDVTPFLSKKSTPVVEIISSGLSKKSESQKSRKSLAKLDTKTQSIKVLKNLDSDSPPSSSLGKRKKDNTESRLKKSALAISLPSSRPKERNSEPKKRRIRNASPEPEKGSNYITRNSDANEALDLGFKDLPVTVVAKKQQGKKHSRSGGKASPAHLDDDTACEVCRRYDSKKSNPMLLCDGCDNGYHIKCVGLEEEPDSDLWFCEKCKPDVTYVQQDVPSLEFSETPPNISNFEQHLKNMQRTVLDKLTGRIPLKLINLDEEIQKVYQIVQQTVLSGEGNSMLIIGSRGTGKSTLVDHVISDISNNHRDDFHVVRLNGFIHTDDRLALKEIWRQLGREMRVDDDDPMMKVSGHHADILVTLLALLSDPSNISETEPNQTAMSVIFILDEFDHFTTHHRQTLLYNLFDIAQSKKAPILVLGLTTKVDVAEMLEKRVKSRFSHRYVQLSLPRSLPAFWQTCKESLTINGFEAENESKELMLAAGYQEFMSYWQAMIENLYIKDSSFMYHLESIFYRTKSVPIFLNSCILPISNLSAQRPILRGMSFQSGGMLLTEPDSKLHILQGLSELELALLIAAARLDVILDTDTCNFAMAYEEYSSLTSRHKIQTSNSGIKAIGASGAKVWGRQVSLDAWEKLARYELLVPVIASGSSLFGAAGHGRDCSITGRMWKVDVALEEIPGSVETLSKVMVKW